MRWINVGSSVWYSLHEIGTIVVDVAENYDGMLGNIGRSKMVV